jgi:hypothetical protein
MIVHVLNGNLLDSDVDPLQNLTGLADPEKALAAIFASGHPIRNRLAS